ncbi:hypothetical protein BDZ89DRAFT_202996 [Hymenopellis radicata]|nr:hypothetical protein BDZ89DRAFT_202996 [Hymenopellis radicata]
MLFQFLYSLLEYFTPPAKYFASMAENPYPAIRDIMTPRRVGRMSTDLWVGAIIEVGITEVNRAQDVLAIRIRSVEQIRLLELHELNIVSLEYDGEVRHYTAERMVEYNPSAPAQTLSARMSHFKGKQVGTRGALDEINSFQSIYEARGYMHKDTGIMESFNVPPTVHLNILHFAVLCQLVSKHCSKLDRLLETMTWLWARSFFVCLRRLCERQHGEPIATARGPAINKMGRLTPAMPRLVTENADVTMSPPEIKKQFLKFFKGSDPREVTVGRKMQGSNIAMATSLM